MLLKVESIQRKEFINYIKKYKNYYFIIKYVNQFLKHYNITFS